MIWSYRVFRDQFSRYSVREVFHEHDGTIIGYSASPVALMGDSPEELLQLLTWFQEAFDLPILSMEDIEAKIATQPSNNAQHPTLSLHEVRAALDNNTIPTMQHHVHEGTAQ